MQVRTPTSTILYAATLKDRVKLKLRSDVGVVDPNLHILRREHWSTLEEKHWTFLKDHFALDPCLLEMHALEVDMCHL